MTEKFKYVDEVFALTTVNRQHTFYYKIKKPFEVWGNYQTQIAFYDKQNSLIYHRQGCFAHVMPHKNYTEFVKWSKTGNLVLFYEYRRGPSHGSDICDYLIIHLEKKVVFRVDLYEQDYSFFDKLDDDLFDDELIIEELQRLSITAEECYIDPISIHKISWLFGGETWKPSDRL